MDTAPHAVVLVLPGGGSAGGVRGGSALSAAAAVPLARRLARVAHVAREAGGAGGVRGGSGRAGGRSAGGAGGGGGGSARKAAEACAAVTPLVTHVVHYGHHGWNGAAAQPADDAEWAADEVVRRYGDVPVALVGTGIGGQAALRTGGHPAVAAVLALAPLLDTETEEPVRQLLGRHVLLVHGTDDTRADPELSFRFAERAKKVNADVCRFEVHSDGHGLRQHAAEVGALAQDFVRGTLCGHDFSRPVADALAAPPPLGLRMPLATGFGATLGR
ncbi:hypothetical protein GCM10009863_61860 [Streptomyces axinellae]|uniref:Alpha/beta hydrolase n=1 Tax=Streptomyces axinellae TaxID=552788 RepID=A0ABP6DC97_9ACTN